MKLNLNQAFLDTHFPVRRIVTCQWFKKNRDLYFNIPISEDGVEKIWVSFAIHGDGTPGNKEYEACYQMFRKMLSCLCSSEFIMSGREIDKKLVLELVAKQLKGWKKECLSRQD